jgi:8-oxo-dGTP diphosphatase
VPKSNSPALIKDAKALVDSYPKLAITVDCVIFGFDDNELKILLIRSDLAQYKNKWTLLGDTIQPQEELDHAADRVLLQRTGMTDVFLKQVSSFSNPSRHPGGRVVTVAYASLLDINNHQLKITDNEIHWHPLNSQVEMAFDHKEIIEVCHTWLQKQIQDQPLAFNLLPSKFSLRNLQNLYEAILNIKLDRRNFRKKFFAMDFLIDTEEMEENVPHRPGKLYKFNFKKYERNKRNWFGIDF